MSSAPLFDGLTKAQVTREAFVVLGVDASLKAVNLYARKKYGTSPIIESMYYGVKARRREELAREVAPPAKKDIWALLKQVKLLADEVGGADKLKQLVDLVQSGKETLDKLEQFVES